MTANHPAIDRNALTAPTVGARPSPRAVTAPPSFSLALDQDLDLGRYLFQNGVPFLHNDGGAPYGNTALGLNALVSAVPSIPYPNYPDYVFGAHNSAFGYGALQNNTTGYRNTAVGSSALLSNTSGLQNTAIGRGALHFNATGSSNTATGQRALYSNTTGIRNTASGDQALRYNTTGRDNTANGERALYSNTSGVQNTASGVAALFANTTGFNNTAAGLAALVNNTEGSNNTAAGFQAMFDNTTGNLNTAIGPSAGVSWTTGSNNIAIGSGARGSVAETGTIRIGGENNQTRTFIEGISNADGTFTTAICIDGDQLGPCSASSERFKQEIEPLEDLREAVRDLRPVSFRYRPEFAGEDDPTVHYGLIAEEVAEIFPSLVSRDDQGRPYTVRYDLLTPLLLAEIQRQQEEIDELKQLRVQVVDLRRSLERLNNPKAVTTSRRRPLGKE